MRLTIAFLAVFSCFSHNSFASTGEANGYLTLQGQDSLAQGEEWDVELEVNGQTGSEMVTIVSKADRLFVKAADLQTFGIKLGEGYVAVDSLDRQAKFDPDALKLSINARPETFEQQVDTFRKRTEAPILENSFGAWLNYDAHLANYGQKSGIQSYLDLNLSTRWGTLVSQHAYNSLATDQPFRRLSTTFRRDDIDGMTTTEIGDTFSIPGYSGTPVRFMGVRMSSNFALKPGFNWIPSYVLAGQATLPSTVEVWEGNRKTYSSKVAPGPFSITDYTPFSTTGDVRMIVRDTFGQEQIISQPIYSAPQQLAQGVDAFTLELGLLRNGYIYGETFFGAGYRRGFDVKSIPLIGLAGRYIPNFTLEGRFEGIRGDTRVSAGIAFSSALGNFSAAGAVATGNGSSGQNSLEQISVAKPYGATSIANQVSSPAYPQQKASQQPSVVNLTWDRQLNLGDFGQISGFASAALPTNWTPIGGIAPQKRLVVLGANYAPKANLVFNYVGVVSGEKPEQVTTHTIGASTTFDGGVTAGVSFTRSESEKGVLLTFSMPLGARGSAFASVAKKGSFGNYSGWSESNQHRWSVGAGQYAGVSRLDASVFSDFQYGRLDASVSRSGENTGYRFGGSGSVAFADMDVWLGKPIAQGLVIADVGVPGVSVAANNRFVGTTNQDGKILITDLAAWRSNQVSLGEDIGDYTANETSAKHVTPRSGGVGVVKLGINSPGYFLRLTLNGRPLGDLDEVRVGGISFPHNPITGAYIENATTGKQHVELGNCHSEITIPALKPKSENRFDFDLKCPS